MAAIKHKEASSSGNSLLSSMSHFTPFNAKLFARTNEILSDAATDIWSGEVELFRLEAEQASRSFAPVRGNGDGNDKVKEWHAGAEKIINQMRTVSDSMRDCSWKLFDLYSQDVLQKFAYKPNGETE